jgi:predicted metal-binding membrane protein
MEERTRAEYSRNSTPIPALNRHVHPNSVENQYNLHDFRWAMSIWERKSSEMPLPMRCNGALIAHDRGLLNLTQLQLPARAGVSERVLRKAEAGETLRNWTLQALGDALTPPGAPLNVFDLTCDTLAGFKRTYTNHGTKAIQR